MSASRRGSCILGFVVGQNDRRILEKSGNFDRSDQKTKIHEITLLSPGYGSSKECDFPFTMKMIGQHIREDELPNLFFDLATIGGARRDRTDDLMLAKHALSQLSYGPVDGRRSWPFP